MLYRILRFFITPMAKLLFRMKIYGKQNFLMPPAVIVANHTDNSDSVCLSVITRRRLYFLVHYSALFQSNKLRFLLKLIRNVYTRNEKGKSQEIIDEAVDIINKKNYFVIFPEGKINPAGGVLKGRTGVARIILQSCVPAIPVAIINSGGMWPDRKSLIPRTIRKVIVNIGKPMYFSKYYGQQNNRKITRKVTDDIMNEIKKLYSEYS